MKVVIDIPDEWETRIEHNIRPNTLECGELVESIWKGKILPKGHGDLIDRSKLKTHFVGTELGTDLEVYLEPTVVEAEAIIEADKEVEDEQVSSQWIDVPIGQYILLYRCPKCLRRSDRKSKYCPNCGKKMEVKNESISM